MMEPLMVRMKPETLATLRRLAEEQERTIASIIRQAVKQYLESPA